MLFILRNTQMINIQFEYLKYSSNDYTHVNYFNKHIRLFACNYSKISKWLFACNYFRIFKWLFAYNYFNKHTNDL